MRGEAGKGGKPGFDRLIFGIRGAVERRQGEESGFFRVLFFLDILGYAERGAEGGLGIAPRIGGRRDIFLEFIAGERRVEGRRKDRQQREQHQEDPRKAAMEAGLTQNEPLSTRRFQDFLHSRRAPPMSSAQPPEVTAVTHSLPGAEYLSGKQIWGGSGHAPA